MKRIYTNYTEQLLDNFPVVAVIGARQVGKSYMCTQLLKQRREYLSLDEIVYRYVANTNPRAIVNKKGPITIDEIQKAPELLNSIKIAVDKNREPGKFLITGSANLRFLPQVQESLAGRIAFTEMYPLTLFERYSSAEKPNIISLAEEQDINAVRNTNDVNINFFDEIFKSSYPEVNIRNDDNYQKTWFNAYVKTYIERDVRQIQNISLLSDFQKLMHLSNLRVANILSVSSLANDTGLNNVTTKRYLNLLYISYQLFELQPYYKNVNKRFIKSPKLYNPDTAFAAFLSSVNDLTDAENFNKTGALIENKIISEIRTLISVFLPQAKLYFYKTHGGGEIDLIIEYKHFYIPIEIKAQSTIKKIKTKTLRNFMSENSKTTKFAIILYLGDTNIEIEKNIHLISAKSLLL